MGRMAVSTCGGIAWSRTRQMLIVRLCFFLLKGAGVGSQNVILVGFAVAGLTAAVIVKSCGVFREGRGTFRDRMDLVAFIHIRVTLFTGKGSMGGVCETVEIHKPGGFLFRNGWNPGLGRRRDSERVTAKRKKP